MHCFSSTLIGGLLSEDADIMKESSRANSLPKQVYWMHSIIVKCQPMVSLVIFLLHMMLCDLRH